MGSHNVLVVDDEVEIRDAIEIYLKNQGINVLKAENGLEALELLETEEIHLIIMDIMMPKMDGIRATFKIRESKNIPIIILSAKSDDSDKILGLDMGADDYVTKPFNPVELIARVKSQLRRYINLGDFSGNSLRKNEGGLVVNKEAKLLIVEGEEIRLTQTEYKIVELLAANRGRVFSIDEIYERVWDQPCFNADNVVAVHIRRIREKIEINPKEPKYIKVVWGIGYKIDKE